MTRSTDRGAAARTAAWSSVLMLWATLASAQPVSQRGFVDGRGIAFPEAAINDSRRFVGDVLLREEVFVRPAPWLQGAAGIDLRANSHSQVEGGLDWDDRGVLRPRGAIRRLSATATAGGFTLDAGKQFVRWGRADVIYPTDRFAPRDYLNVFDAELLPVLGVRPSLQFRNHAFEGVWLVRPTPSRLPLFNQRWTVLPPEAAGMRIIDGGSRFDDGGQYGVRWRHTGPRLEAALMFFDGVNHLPDIAVREVTEADEVALELTRVFPKIRMYGADLAVPTSFVTWKLEAAYVTAPSDSTEEYVLYVIEVERQIGEWLLDVGYAGDVTTDEKPQPAFSPDRGMARSFIGRATYTIDPQRTMTIEGAVRQAGEGIYGKAEYSQAFGSHWRLNVSGVALGGERTDFLGQFQDNSHVSLGLRFSY